jgi:type II secretory pathway component PulF
MKTYDRIKSGETLYGELQSNGRLVPATDTQIINVGEASGTLSDSLAYIATIHEDELNDITRNLSSILEPILFIFLGVVVAILAMSIITPIYSITDQFH